MYNMCWFQGIFVVTTIVIGSQLFLCLKKLDKFIVRLDNALEVEHANITHALDRTLILMQHVESTTDEFKVTAAKVSNLCDAIQFVPMKNKISKMAHFPFRFCGGKKDKEDKVEEPQDRYQIIARLPKN